MSTNLLIVKKKLIWISVHRTKINISFYEKGYVCMLFLYIYIFYNN